MLKLSSKITKLTHKWVIKLGMRWTILDPSNYQLISKFFLSLLDLPIEGFEELLNVFFAICRIQEIEKGSMSYLGQHQREIKAKLFGWCYDERAWVYERSNDDAMKC